MSWRRVTTACLLISLAALAVGATEQDASNLPSVLPYQCLNCHVSADPTSGPTDLNPFGRDYRGAGRQWSAQLAQMDSDGDGCTNGAELGDVDGDGQLDQGVERESSNPGVDGDCSSASLLDEVSWSTLKSMFDGRR